MCRVEIPGRRELCLRQIEFVGPDLSTMGGEKRRIRRQLSFSMTVQSEVNDEKV